MSAPIAGTPVFELRARKAELEAESRSLAQRNRLLTAALLAGFGVLFVVLFFLYLGLVRPYAVLEDVTITRQPADQGRLEIRFRVAAPGKVFYRRTSGKIETEMVDHFPTASVDPQQRRWSWVYEPGEDVEVSLLYRSGFWRRSTNRRFPTARHADIVILMDTTGSMSRSIALLKDRCVTFSQQLKKQALSHRFALIGFGDTQEGDWLDAHPFTADVESFRRNVEALKRFDGGDLPESALDAVEAGLALPFEPDGIRRFYLVTDAAYHEPTQSGATAADVAARLESKRVLLSVFSRPEFAGDYFRLFGKSGKFHDLESFGHVLAEGRILED